MALVVDDGRACMAPCVVCKMHTKFANFTKKSQPCTRRPPRKVDSAESRGDVWGRGKVAVEGKTNANEARRHDSAIKLSSPQENFRVSFVKL